MELAIIGLLWCKGESEEKSEYLFNIAKMSKRPGHSNIASATSVSTNKTNPPIESGKDILVWTSPNIKHIFSQIFRVAIDLPIDMKEEFKDIEILD